MREARHFERDGGNADHRRTGCSVNTTGGNFAAIDKQARGIPVDCYGKVVPSAGR